MAPTHNLNSAGMHQPIHFQHSNCTKMEQTGMDTVKSSNTLQSLLHGEVPSAYMHLTSSCRSTVHNSKRFVSEKSDSIGTSSLSVRDRDHEHSYRPYPCNSSHMRSNHQHSPQSRTVPSPQRTSSPLIDRYTVFRNGSGHQDINSYLSQGYERSSPAYEGRSSPFQESGSPFIGSSPYYNTGSPSRPYSPSQLAGSPHSINSAINRESPYHSPQTATSPYSGSQLSNSNHYSIYNSEGYSAELPEVSHVTEDQPIDLSCKSYAKNVSNEFLSEENDSSDNMTNGSMLRHLLRPGKQSHESCMSDNGRDSPGSDIYRPDIPVTGTTRVTLAKKMVYPITSRVSDWLVKIVQFSKSIPEFYTMSQNDKMTLLLNSWTRMLLLLMAENDYEFAVTPLHCDQKSDEVDGTPSQEEPTMKSVEGIQTFIRKCKNMHMDQKEYALLRMAVLFNSGNIGLDDSDLVEKLNAAVQQLLQQHIKSSRPNDVMHYSKILMLLPSLYGINCRMVENLFCKRINTDLQVLLKEMLQNL
ncbi:DNA hairpin binding [Mactra antiquata]